MAVMQRPIAVFDAGLGSYSAVELLHRRLPDRDIVYAAHPGIKAVTLSSTHLPWLRDYFEQARPELRLFDPIEDVVDRIRPLSEPGSGAVLGLVTENERYPASEFREMLARLGID